MTESVIALSRHPASGMAAGAGARVKIAWRGFRKRMRIRDTIAQLRTLDDRTLKDIGIHRSEIVSIGWGIGFDRTPRHH
jgi:uncharacterized protein YjiS (DUF1127 family)